MFSWSIAKTAEAMLTRWTIKRVCKFMLKKKLGKFILGDIDPSQLDVQLSAGTIQLSDLALNVDYINEKLGIAAVLVKEGSIGSLVVTMPWKEGGCRIEVDELEIVLSPHRANVSDDEFETTSPNKTNSSNFSHGLRNVDNEAINSTVANAFVDVHEGVKTVAKVVKGLLSSFHVKIKKLIVAFDTLADEGNTKELDRILVLRIGEIECGTHMAEDGSPGSFATAHNFLGLSRLTTFVKFQGAVLELLNVDGIDNQSPPESTPETTLGNWYSGYCSSGNMTMIIAGETGGFSGNLKLTIPWKNGSLDISRVEADLHIEPLELRIQPSTIRYLISMFDLFKSISEKLEDQDHHGVFNGSSAPACMLSGKEQSGKEVSVTSYGVFNGSSAPVSCMLSGKEQSGKEVSVTSCSLMEKESVDFLLSESHLISDWASKIQKDRNEEEPDFGASVDQFFECFDELRNSQSALGNSGMWNWTCSVFSAITAASNLASGSLHITTEQQHVETKFNATVVKASFLFFFIDEDQEQSPKVKGDKANLDVYAHCLCAQFVDLLIELQVRPQEINVDATVQHVQLVDHLHSKIESVHTGKHGCTGSDISVIWKMQDGVEGAIRTLQEPSKDPRLDCQVNYSIDVSLNAQEINKCCHMTSVKGFCWKQASVTLLKTSGVSLCHVTVKSGSFGASVTGPISLSLKLPPFVCWVNFDLITMVLEFLDQMGNSVDSNHAESGFVQKSETKGYGFEPSIDQEKNLHREATTSPAKFSMESVIFLPNARIIVCFPLKEHREYNSYSSCDQFLTFDFISPTIGGKNVRPSRQIPTSSSNKRLTGTVSCSLHLNLGDFYVYSISAAFTEKIVGRRIYSGNESSFSAEKIISVANEAGNLSLISLFWQDGPVSGPWIAKKAKLLVSSEIARSKDKVVGKGCEFASVTTIKDTADFEARTRQEILSTSSFLLQAQIPPVCINLGKSQYENLYGLLDQLFEHLQDVVSSSARSREESSALQASILVECSSVTISIAIEPASDLKGSMFKELPGSWVNLTLQVDKFDLLSASDIGGIRNFNLFWLTHGQGSLWGSATEGLQRKFLLISCSDSVMGRGNGEGSNVLSSRYSGSNIVNLWDPESNHNFTSITVKCPSIVATGGRLDWCNAIVSFFSRSSSDFEPPNNDGSERAFGSSFSLILVDVGLSYEPYCNKLANNEGLDPEFYDLSANGSRDELNVAGFLAAASLKLFNTTGIGCTEGEYKIKLQDLGLLIRGVSESKLVGSIYSVEHLRKLGYVKVAEEAHVEARLKTNCDNGLVWELECAESHITLNTCHDTTFGLIKLASQLQNLFAPDMQDYAEHLENRWKNAQQIHGDSYYSDFGNQVSPSASQTQNSSLDKGSKVGSLMDEVCENVFQLDENSGVQHSSRREALGSESYPASSRASSSGESVPEFIEEYFLSDLRPLSELVFRSQPSDILCNKTHTGGEAAQIGNGGWYGDNSLQILENHASKVEYHSNIRKLMVKEPSTSNSDHVDGGKAVGRILLRNMDVIWRMYGGADWCKFHTTSQAAAMFCGRDTSACLELAFSGIEVKYDAYPDGEIFASKLSVTIQDFCLNDKSDNAPWKLVLGYHQSMKHPRMFSAKAVKLNLEIVKPDPSLPLEENRLRIALLPIRLHLHQSQLDFLISFFGGKDSSTDSSHSNVPIVLEKSGVLSDTSGSIKGLLICEEAFLPYFQKFDISPMSIRVDYSPSHVDLTALRSGKYVELVNLVPWKGVEIQLKHIRGVGLYGWDSVFEAILGEWLEDISQNQIHKLLKGLPPIKSLVAVGSGAAKLVSLPVKSYKKDKRLLKGMQRGTVAFLRSISLEAIGLGVHLAAGAHNVLLQAEYILTTIPPTVPWPTENRVASNVRSNQPKDAQQGIQQACQSIADGLGKSASALLQTPLKRYQRGAGVGSALATAVQSAPAAAIAPASAAARAVHCALLGFRNSLDPEHRRESVEKYLGRSPPRESMQ